MDIRILITLILPMLASCTTQPTTNQTSRASRGIHFEISNDIYAKLERDIQGYSFTDIQTMTPKANGAWVNLKNGHPTWETDKIKVCGRGFMKGPSARTKSCDDIKSETFFLNIELDSTANANRLVAGIFTLGLSLTGVSYKVEFDQHSYAIAYNQAAKKLSTNVISKVDRMTTKLNDILIKKENIYLSAIASARQQVNININDKSKLYQKNTNLNRIASYRGNAFPMTLMNPSVNAPDINNLLLLLQNRLSTLDADIKYFNADVSVTCYENKIRSYNYDILCPKKMPVINGNVAGEITLKILSKNVKDILPPHIKQEDAKLEITLNDHFIGLRNKSNVFVTVSSIAFYHNGKIAQMKNLNIELSPNSKLEDHHKLNIRDFAIDWNELSFPKLTKEKAKSIQLEYGFAVKYAISDAEGEKTLYAADQYSLFDLITNKHSL